MHREKECSSAMLFIDKYDFQAGSKSSQSHFIIDCCKYRLLSNYVIIFLKVFSACLQGEPYSKNNLKFYLDIIL